MTVPDAPNTAVVRRPTDSGSPSASTSADSRTVAVEPRASAIWEATVRFQISS